MSTSTTIVRTGINVADASGKIVHTAGEFGARTAGTRTENVSTGVDPSQKFGEGVQDQAWYKASLVQGLAANAGAAADTLLDGIEQLRGQSFRNPMARYDALHQVAYGLKVPVQTLDDALHAHESGRLPSDYREMRISGKIPASILQSVLASGAQPDSISDMGEGVYEVCIGDRGFDVRHGDDGGIELRNFGRPVFNPASPDLMRALSTHCAERIAIRQAVGAELLPQGRGIDGSIVGTNGHPAMTWFDSERGGWVEVHAGASGELFATLQGSLIPAGQDADVLETATKARDAVVYRRGAETRWGQFRDPKQIQNHAEFEAIDETLEAEFALLGDFEPGLDMETYKPLAQVNTADGSISVDENGQIHAVTGNAGQNEALCAAVAERARLMGRFAWFLGRVS